MDLGRYKELKGKGVVTMQLLGDQVLVVSKKYDTATGEPLVDSAIPIDEKSLLAQKASMEVQLAAITEFLEDVKGAKK